MAGTAGAGGAPIGGAGGAPAGSGGSAGSGTCSTLFVKSGSLMSNDGCTEAAPLPSVSSALALAKKLGSVKEVHVCAGTFVEPATLEIDHGVLVRGSFTCPKDPTAAWKAPPTTAKAASTIVSFASSTAVRFAGGVGRDAGLEGFAIDFSQAPAVGAPSIAIDLAAGASPTLRFNRVSTSTLVASGPTYGAIGLQVGAGSAALIQGNAVGSMAGMADVAPAPVVAASVGVVLNQPSKDLVFQENEVTPGVGTTATLGSLGTIAVVLTLGTDPITLRDNRIVATEGRYVGPALTALEKPVNLGVGLLAGAGVPAPGKLTVVGGVIAGPRGVAQQVPGGVEAGVAKVSFVAGVVLGAAGKPHVDASFDHVRLYGGDLVAETTAATGEVFPQSAACVGENVSIQLFSSLLHGGGLEATTPFTRAMLLTGGVTVDSAYSTFVGGAPRPDPASNHRNQLLFGAYGPDVKVNVSHGLLVGTDGSTIAVSGAGKGCDVAAPTGSGYVLQTDASVFVRDQDLGDGGITEAFAGGDPACPHLGSAPGASAQSAGHIVGDLLQVVGAIDNETAKVPTIGGCGEPATCFKVVFPKGPGQKRADFLDTASLVYRPACTDDVPDAVTGLGAASQLAPETKLDLVGVDRTKAQRVGPGALVSCP